MNLKVFFVIHLKKNLENYFLKINSFLENNMLNLLSYLYLEKII